MSAPNTAENLAQELARLPQDVRGHIFRFMRHPVADLLTEEEEVFPKVSIYSDIIKLFEFIVKHDRVDPDDYGMWLYDFDESLKRPRSRFYMMKYYMLMHPSGLWRARSLVRRYIDEMRGINYRLSAMVPFARKLELKLNARLALAYY